MPPMVIRVGGSWALALLVVTSVGCSKKKSADREHAAASKQEATAVSADKAILGCALAKQCGEAAVAAGVPWKNHGSSMLSAAERGNEAGCNEAAFIMLRAAALEPLLSPPAGCKTDMDALFEAVGRPFDNCRLLEECAGALDAKFTQEAAMARDVATSAKREGTFGGERICLQTWTALLEKAPVALAEWPKACGGQL